MSKNYSEALIFSIKAHQGQFRKISKEPYIIHPIQVSEQLLEWFPNHPDLKDMRIAAILHDVLEDTWVTYKVLKENFGEKIADTVYELSKRKETGMTNDDCEEKYKEKLCESKRISKLIKLADMWCNFQDTGNDPKWIHFYETSLEIVKEIRLEDSKYTDFFEEKRKELLEKAEKYLKRFL